MDPEDGYYAAVVSLWEVRSSLYFGLNAGGEMIRQTVIEVRQRPTAVDIGELKRKLLVWQGIAEFLNAGGDLEEMRSVFAEELISQVQGFLRYPGWRYFDTGVSSNGNCVHEFINDDGDRFVRWVHNEYIDSELTPEQMSESDNDPDHPGASSDSEDLREYRPSEEGPTQQRLN